MPETTAAGKSFTTIAASFKYVNPVHLIFRKKHVAKNTFYLFFVFRHYVKPTFFKPAIVVGLLYQHPYLRFRLHMTGDAVSRAMPPEANANETINKYLRHLTPV
ncbi:Uncharacterised protein [uncultured archaeon]|nr:Uncharacterised protein [uncultured archaeon]